MFDNNKLPNHSNAAEQIPITLAKISIAGMSFSSTAGLKLSLINVPFFVRSQSAFTSINCMFFENIGFFRMSKPYSETVPENRREVPVEPMNPIRQLTISLLISVSIFFKIDVLIVRLSECMNGQVLFFDFIQSPSQSASSLYRSPPAHSHNRPV